MKRFFLLLMLCCLVGCNSQPAKQKPQQTFEQKHCPPGAYNIRNLNDHWSTFDLNVDGKKHSFLIHFGGNGHAGVIPSLVKLD